MKKIIDTYDKYFLFMEFVFSIVLTFLILWVINIYSLQDEVMNVLKGSRSALYGAIAGVAGSLLGFVITGLSILLVTGNSEGMNALRSSKYYYQIFKVFLNTSKYLGLLVVLSLVSLIIDRDAAPLFEVNMVVLWGVIIVTFRILRCLWVLENIIGINKQK
ncbi:hypothetical protein [Paenibacillus sp. Cedars]|uniref:hypothetical protein n=1 Tax=Paenibacillus sp. Cedars TaxID=1980674 RepID=UPI0011632FCE|nr:hypothetical protein [Paenibacillus sp. Cedars]AWP26362.1 hypothetical protein B9D94_06930 [Paenibacillus sp. Cedars]